MVYSPVLIKVYERYAHLKMCVESLKKNEEAIHTELYVVSDAPFRDEDAEAVKKVREYVKGIKGFKKVHLIANKKNKGAFLSGHDAKYHVFKFSNRLIFMEDDITVSPHFLRFMNLCLEKYKDYKKVFAVTGYNHPYKIPNNYPFSAYFIPGYPAWGIGIWRDREIMFDNEYTKRRDEFIQEHQSYIPQFKKFNYESYRILMNDLNGKVIAGDVRHSFFQFCNEMVTIHPVISLTKSNGHDGSGLNCPYDYILQNQPIDNVSREYVLPEKVFVDPTIYRRRQRYFSNISKKVKTLKRMYYNNIFIKKLLVR